MQLKVLPNDVTFTMPRDAGLNCLCSRCLVPIIEEVPVKIIPTNIKNLPKDKHEFRYHMRCIKTKPLKKGDWGENYENLPY